MHDARQHATSGANPGGDVRAMQVEPAARFACEHQAHLRLVPDLQHGAGGEGVDGRIEQQVLAQRVGSEIQISIGRAARQQQLAGRCRVAVAVAIDPRTGHEHEPLDRLRRGAASRTERQAGQFHPVTIIGQRYFGACNAAAAARYLAALGTSVHAGLTGSLAMSCNATAIMRFTLARLS